MTIQSKNIETVTYDGISRMWRSPMNQYYTREHYHDKQPALTKNLPLFLEFVNDEHCFQKYYRKRESSEVFSIELVLQGSMYFNQGDKNYHVMPGAVFLVHHDRNNEFYTGPGGHCHRLACAISGHELNVLLHTTKLIEVDVIKLNNLEKIEKIMRECFRELKEKQPEFRRKASVLSYQLLLELGANLQQVRTPEILIKAVGLMEHHLSKQLTLKELASVLNTSPTSLSRMFQQHFNTSPIKYFIELKTEVAKSLLLNTDFQIQEIAERVGYNSAFYFSSEFKKRTGKSPRSYRNAQI